MSGVYTSMCIMVSPSYEYNSNFPNPLHCSHIVPAGIFYNTVDYTNYKASVKCFLTADYANGLVSLGDKSHNIQPVCF